MKTFLTLILIAIFGWMIAFFTIPAVKDWTMYGLFKIERQVETKTPEEETSEENELPAPTQEIGGDVIG